MITVCGVHYCFVISSLFSAVRCYFFICKCFGTVPSCYLAHCMQCIYACVCVAVTGTCCYCTQLRNQSTFASHMLQHITTNRCNQMQQHTCIFSSVAINSDTVNLYVLPNILFPRFNTNIYTISIGF